MHSKWFLAAAVFLVAGVLGAQPLPIVGFYLVPDDNLGPGSESMLVGTVPGPMGPTQVAFDFTAGHTANDFPYMTLVRDAQNPTLFSVPDLRLTAVDPALGATLVLVHNPAQLGSWSSGLATFPQGATVTCTLPVLISVTGGGLGPGFPTSGTLSLSGPIVPGYYHQTVPLQGTLDALPGATVTLHAKQDLFPPGIRWVHVLDGGLSTARRTGQLPEAVFGSMSLMRNPLQHNLFTLGPVELTLAQAPTLSLTAAATLGGTLQLDPITRAVSGQITWAVGGTSVTRVLDGVGESFSGQAVRPTGLTLQETNLGPLEDLSLALRLVELVPGGSVPQFGTTYQPVFRAPPGKFYGVAASLDAAPGINTTVGDIPVELDPLFWFSITANPFLQNQLGTVPANGEVHIQVHIPADGNLIGFTFFLGGVVMDLSVPENLAVTQAHRVIIQ